MLCLAARPPNAPASLDEARLDWRRLSQAARGGHYDRYSELSELRSLGRGTR